MNNRQLAEQVMRDRVTVNMLQQNMCNARKAAKKHRKDFIKMLDRLRLTDRIIPQVLADIETAEDFRRRGGKLWER